MSDAPRKCMLLAMSGDFDHAFAVFSIASSAAAMGMETTVFFTFWGLKAIQRGNFTGKGLFGRMVGVLNRGGIERIGPSKFNFGGIGRWMFKKMMKDKGVTALTELRQQCIELGVKFLACKTSLDVMEITEEDLIPEVTAVVGAATMIAATENSQFQFFI